MKNYDARNAALQEALELMLPALKKSLMLEREEEPKPSIPNIMEAAEEAEEMSEVAEMMPPMPEGKGKDKGMSISITELGLMGKKPSMSKKKKKKKGRK